MPIFQIHLAASSIKWLLELVSLAPGCGNPFLYLLITIGGAVIVLGSMVHAVQVYLLVELLVWFLRGRPTRTMVGVLASLAPGYGNQVDHVPILPPIHAILLPIHSEGHGSVARRTRQEPVAAVYRGGSTVDLHSSVDRPTQELAGNSVYFVMDPSVGRAMPQDPVAVFGVISVVDFSAERPTQQRAEAGFGVGYVVYSSAERPTQQEAAGSDVDPAVERPAQQESQVMTLTETFLLPNLQASNKLPESRLAPQLPEVPKRDLSLQQCKPSQLDLPPQPGLLGVYEDICFVLDLADDEKDDVDFLADEAHCAWVLTAQVYLACEKNVVKAGNLLLSDDSVEKQAVEEAAVGLVVTGPELLHLVQTAKRSEENGAVTGEEKKDLESLPGTSGDDHPRAANAVGQFTRAAKDLDILWEEEEDKVADPGPLHNCSDDDDDSCHTTDAVVVDNDDDSFLITSIVDVAEDEDDEGGEAIGPDFEVRQEQDQLPEDVDKEPSILDPPEQANGSTPPRLRRSQRQASHIASKRIKATIEAWKGVGSVKRRKPSSNNQGVRRSARLAGLARPVYCD